jgi:cytochrome c biogenesis protein CcmG/thiol:disulfide interchange protein DsbE
MPLQRSLSFPALFLMIFIMGLPASAYAVKDGDDALEFTLPVISGGPDAAKEISLSDYKGRVVYLDFWATWCPPCRQTFPWMDEMHAAYEKDGLSIIAVSIDHKRDIIEHFVKQREPRFLVVQDNKGFTYRNYKIPGMPTSYLIDRDGRIVLRHVGFRARDRKDLEKAIRDLLQR